MNNASLIVVGLGIKFKSHLTVEAHTYVKNSDKVFYLVNEPAMREWIKQNNPNSESLESFYGKYTLRIDCYNAMSQHVLEALRKNQHICFVLYGHPTVFAKPALDAVIQAKKEGFFARILPGISAEDCLFSDLLINPGSNGCQSYEATDFLIYKKNIEPSCHIILWQVGIIGALNYPKTHNNSSGIELLLEELKQYYNLNHNVIIYEAAQYPHLEPRIESIPLEKLPFVNLTSLTTLYISPICKPKCDLKNLKILNIPITQQDIFTD